MFGKSLRLALIVMIAGGVPYAWFNDRIAQTLRTQAGQWLPKRSSSGGGLTDIFIRKPADTSLAATVPTRQAPPQPASRSDAKAELREIEATKTQSDPLAAVLRMDVTHGWIIDRWPRISTVRAEPNLLGFRVPYVSGTRTDDISGSLTYYFDDLGRLSRVQFHGYTGDHRRLIDVVSDLFQLRAEPNLRGGLLVGRWNARPTSVLWVGHAPIVRADEPHWRYELKLEINRPDYRYGLSLEFAELLQVDRQSLPSRDPYGR